MSDKDAIYRQVVIDSFEAYAEMLRIVLDNTDIVGNEREKFAWGLELIESFISDMKELPSAETECTCCEYRVGDLCCYSDVKTDMEAYEQGKRDAQPERKKGQWDFIGWQMFQCSECKHTFTQDFLEGWRAYTYESFFPPFCPNCGAKMDTEEESDD